MIPALRQMSWALMPCSASFRKPMICSSVKRLFRMRFLSSLVVVPGELTFQLDVFFGRTSPALSSNQAINRTAIALFRPYSGLEARAPYA
ncbi:hypothetical protein D3C86_1932380 [compost metagenome]